MLQNGSYDYTCTLMKIFIFVCTLQLNWILITGRKLGPRDERQLEMILATRSDLCPLTDHEMNDSHDHCSKNCPFWGNCKKNRHELCVKRDKNCVCMCNIEGDRFGTLRNAWEQWLLKEKPAYVKEPCSDEEVDEAAEKRRWHAEVKPRIEKRHGVKRIEHRKSRKRQWFFGKHVRRWTSLTKNKRDEYTAEQRKSESELREERHKNRRRKRERDKSRRSDNLACDMHCPRETNGYCHLLSDGRARRCFCKDEEYAVQTRSVVSLPLESAKAKWGKDPCDRTLTLFTDYCGRACPCGMRGLCLSQDGQSHGDLCFCYEQDERKNFKLKDITDQCACTSREHLEECCDKCLTILPPKYTPPSDDG